MEKELKKLVTLGTERLSLEEIKALITILVCHLTTNSIKIIKDASGNFCEIKDDSIYCCVYFKIKDCSQNQKELSVVFNKEKYCVTVGIFMFKNEVKDKIETESKEISKIPPLILPDIIAIFNFDTLKNFSDNLSEISHHLR